MRILVTGGAGYIGSHVVLALKGHDVTILDNLSTGHKQAITHGELVVGDLKDQSMVEELFKTKNFEAVMHFAGSIVVPDSVANPLSYYQNNTLNSHFLLSMCVKYKVSNFIFSSTAAVYGIVGDSGCKESSPLVPINPYGHSKLMTEQMLLDTSSAHPEFKFVALRYFNVSGADPEGRVGQSFPGATHLIKSACEAAVGKRAELKIFGTDYPTKDGTCVRDFIHVSDLADAHVRALEYLEKGGKSEILNCGYGQGYSVKEVIAMVKNISGSNFKVTEVARRAGDPASVVSVVDKIHKTFEWKPRFNNLKTIVTTALDWEKQRPY